MGASPGTVDGRPDARADRPAVNVVETKAVSIHQYLRDQRIAVQGSLATLENRITEGRAVMQFIDHLLSKLGPESVPTPPQETE